MNSDIWVGFNHLNDLGISPDQFSDYDVLCLPENIEKEVESDKLFEAEESVHLYKILKSRGIKAYCLHDFGCEVPIYERRGETIYFGVLVIQYIVYPIVAGIIANWITEKLYHKNVRVVLHIIKNDKEEHIDYDGDGETLLKLLESLKEKRNAGNEQDN